jgi:hypothetical protein
MNRLGMAILSMALAGPAAMAESAPVRAETQPRALIIGDSISIGYTPEVQRRLKDRVTVKRHRGNAQHTGTGLRMLDTWLGTEKWDVIHFNWGLWDLCYRDLETKSRLNRDKVNGVLTTSLEQYETNLEELVLRLKKTGAKLIWAHTTVVPDNDVGRFAGDDKKYNAAAARIMRKHGVAINDLNALTRGFPADLFQGPGDVHFTREGYRRIAGQVAESILAVLPDVDASGGQPAAEADQQRPEQKKTDDRLQ